VLGLFGELEHRLAERRDRLEQMLDVVFEPPVRLTPHDPRQVPCSAPTFGEIDISLSLRMIIRRRPR